MKINLIDCFEKTVNEKTQLIAVKHNSDQITFGDLKRRAENLACVIAKKTNNVINKPVAVFLPKEINAVVADLAIMYASETFMNLDVKTPPERIGNIISLIEPCAIVTSTRYAEKLPQVSCEIILADEETEPADEDLIMLENRRKMIIDTDPLCIINTSGSTGTPKGVVLNHRSFFDFMSWAYEEFNFDSTEIIGSLSPIVFDIFDFELCMMILHGARLILLDASLASFPVRLIESLNNNDVNFIFWVPSVMVNIANLDLLSKVKIPQLKYIWFAGEVFPVKQFLYWYDKLPDCRFVNLYGPIEITLDCTYYEVKKRPDEDKPLPIGTACKNTDVLILNENDKLCGINEEGELCVRGTSLAMGYYNNPQKTSAAFVQNPLNKSYPELIYRTGDIAEIDETGLIHFKGRKDSLIKHMGYRIELGEIEHVIINDLKMVQYCCAVYNYEAKEIVLFYEKDSEITPVLFRKNLIKVFPAYMIPMQYIRMDLLPRNTNGKIDRLKLKNQINEVNANE